MRKRILLLLGVLVLAAQFLRPDRSVPPVDPANDMLTVTAAPADIRQLVEDACYDCHSDRTSYPWYAHVTPMNFIVQQHVNEGRAHLNFSRWDRFAGGEEAQEAAEELQEGEMPPGYYRLMHGHARLGDADKRRLVAWFNTAFAHAGSGGSIDAGEDGEEAH